MRTLHVILYNINVESLPPSLISGVWEEAQHSYHRGDHEGVEICGDWERVKDGQALHHE